MPTSTMKNSFLLFIIFSAFIFSQCNIKTTSQQPNILLIISDDQGYADYSAYGGANDVQTPNMDRITNQGILFTSAYASSPVCSSSRSGLIT